MPSHSSRGWAWARAWCVQSRNRPRESRCSRVRRRWVERTAPVQSSETSNGPSGPSRTTRLRVRRRRRTRRRGRGPRRSPSPVEGSLLIADLAESFLEHGAQVTADQAGSGGGPARVGAPFRICSSASAGRVAFGPSPWRPVGPPRLGPPVRDDAHDLPINPASTRRAGWSSLMGKLLECPACVESPDRRPCSNDWKGIHRAEQRQRAVSSNPSPQPGNSSA